MSSDRKADACISALWDILEAHGHRQLMDALQRGREVYDAYRSAPVAPSAELPRLHPGESIGNPGTLPREAYAPPSASEQITPLERFGLAVLEEHRNEITDLDGGWIQDKAVELGVLAGVNVTEPCSAEWCKCAEYGDFPQECLRETDAIRAKMAEHRATKKPADSSATK